MEIKAFRTFLKCNTVFRPDEIGRVLKVVRHYFRFAYSNKKTKYFDVPCAFDIETSSFYNKDGDKVAIMYEWTFGIFGAVIIGRTWDEFTRMMTALSDALSLNEYKRLIVYVHNLGYEFQFLRKYFCWTKVFSGAPRTPIYGVTDLGIEFRCSLLLSGYRLETLADNLQIIEIKKLTGNLDYKQIRHSKTPLTADEIAYCVNDVKIVMAYIAERIELDGNICRLPLTKTGYVRNYCRQSCFYTPGVKRKDDYKRLRYMEIMKGMTLTADEYKQLKRAFQGGFTHANPFASGQVMRDVTSFDFTSSYPAVMLSERFPSSSSEEIRIRDKQEFEFNLKYYCCLFDVEFFGLSSRLYQDNYLSLSRCWGTEKAVTNNGRVVSADHLYTTVTEQDWNIIQRFYQWDHIRIYHFRRYRKDYLPTDFVKAILKLYQDKTTLKDVSGSEIEYARSKEMLNSCYGMTVTDIVRQEIEYRNDEWVDPENLPPLDFEKEIKKYNNSRGRFLFYPWGVWVTAYARRNLFSGILEFGSDYIYSDTDSIKVVNADDHMEYINEYNRRIRNQLRAAMTYHGIDPDEIEPETIEGKKKTLGVWDFDGHYSMFKTLGAKRYMVQYSSDPRNKKKNQGKVNITVSGLNKQTCVPYLLNESNGNVEQAFDMFSDQLYIPPEFTGKMTHTYIDQPRHGYVTDYLGKRAEYTEKTCVHLSESDYSLSISREYADYLLCIKDVET